MNEKIRCQSCGMVLAPGFYGTETDGSQNMTFCKFCYRDGGFTNPGETLQSMIEKSINNMTSELSLPRDEAEKLAHAFIPKLKRWVGK